MVVAPATANTLAKMAAGMADNLLTAIYLAFRGPVIVAPTMNWAMNEHPATVENLRVLADRGVEVLPTESGELACGEEGSGRMASPAAIRMAVRRALAGTAAGPLAGKRVVVTSGGTRERIDAVRFIGNRSSGKMGRAVADEAYLRGAEVTLITTQPADDTPYAVVPVESADQMAAAVDEHLADAAVLVMAAAVADFRPAEADMGKIERGAAETLSLHLVRTVDILARVAASRPVPRRLRRGGGPAAAAGAGQEGRQGRRPARLQRHPRRGRGHRLGRERDHHPHGHRRGARAAHQQDGVREGHRGRDRDGTGGEMSLPERDHVVAMLEERVLNDNLRRHMIATEAIMRGVAVAAG